MKTRVTLLSLLLLVAICMVAQNAAPASQSPAAPSSTPNTDLNQTQQTANQAATATESGSNPTSLKGCLSGSAASGTYILTDEQTGAVYTLAGNFDALRTHVGEAVEVTGQPAAASANTGISSAVAASSANSTSTGKLFQATGAHRLADHCKPTGTPRASKRPLSTYELALVAEQTGSGAGSGSSGQGGSAGSGSNGSGTSGKSTPGTTPAPGQSTPPAGSASPAPGTATPPPGTASPAPGAASPPPSTASPAPGAATPDTSPAAPGTTPGAWYDANSRTEFHESEYDTGHEPAGK